MEQRINLRFLARKGPHDCYKLLREVYGEDGMSRSHVFEWHQHFVSGHMEVKDDPKSGRPSTVTTTENIDRRDWFITSLGLKVRQ